MNSLSPHNTPPDEPKHRVKKLLATFMMALTIASPAAVVGLSAGMIGIFAPQPVHAQLATSQIASVPNTVKSILEKIFYGLVTAAKVGIKNSLRSFLEKIAYDTAVWIGSGDENQKPLLFTKDAGTYLQEAGDAAAGEFLNTLATENGFLEFNLCDLPEIEALRLKLTLPTLLGKEPYEPACTFSEIKQELSDTTNYYKDMAAQLMDDPRSLINVTTKLDNGENALSSLLATMDEAIGAETAEERKATIEQLQSGAKSSTANVSGYIQTPAFLVEAEMVAAVNKSSDAELIQTDNIVADALSVFVNTLASKLLERVTTGIISFFTETDVSESVATGGGSTVTGASGKSGAEAMFAEFKTTSFNTGGTVDILSHFANCPEEGAEVTNCVVNESLRLAIDEQLNLAEAIDQGVLDGTTLFGFGDQATPINSPEEGISLRNIEVLKSYGVVPVGWQLAAEYIRDFDSSSTYTLQSMIDAFDDCDSDNYSPYCGLVDPYWTLKAPQVFCNLEGYGSILTVDEFIDTDGATHTPNERVINRLTSCIDPQTCLAEDDTGFCEEYGYCAKYDRIYRFDGTECPEQFASCEMFTTTDGDEAEIGYLKNTLNYNDCTTDNRGCEWLCTAYAAVDDAFRCEDQDIVYTECDSSQATYDASALTCGCTEDDSGETCDIAEGGFYCTTDSGYTCTLGTESESAAGIDVAINFDNDVESCDSSSNGCTEFSPVYGGSNLVFNGSFEHFAYDEDADGVYDVEYKEEDDDNINYLQAIDEADATTWDAYAYGYYGSAGDGADPSLAGEPCTAYSSTQYCYGWELADDIKVRAVDESLYGNTAIQLQDQADNASGSTGYILYRFETGQPLANRTFSLIFAALNSDSDCTANYWVAPDGVSGTDLDAYKTEYTYSASGTFGTVTATPVTFADSVTETVVNIGFEQANGCDLVLEQVKLEENYASSGFHIYGDEDNLAYLNTEEMLSCEVDEVGCDLFTPITGESDLDVPGQITNPMSADCGDGDDYTDPACSQCIADYVGCDYYIEVEMPYDAPIKDIYGFNDTAYHTGTLAEAVANRTGLYCSDNSGTACNSDADCDTGVLCLPSVSIVPSTGTTCSASQVGCEQYINIDEQAAGGEGVYYYQYIRQCVKETTDQTADDEIRIYYTFEGDDITGYQLRSWTLKKSNYDMDGSTGDAAPCVNLDLYDWNEDTVQTPKADCVDAELVAAGVTTISDCDPSTDADCAEFWDGNGNNYYRLMSATISVSDECSGYRNTLDNRIYYTIADESQSCSASSNMCREYQGSQAGNVQTIIDEDFDDSVYDGGTSSSTTVTANVGQSMEVPSGTSASYSISGLPEEGKSYVATFWAKAATSGDKISMYINSASLTSTTYIEEEVELTDSWKKYIIGPGVIDAISTDLDETFYIANAGSGSVYIDNLEVQESSSHYLILDSADTCYGYEGCEQYQDNDGDTHYLKSFKELCDENAIGCEALIQTRNSVTPYYTLYNDDNEYTDDDIAVDTDSVAFYAVNNGAICSDSDAGCTIYGQPDLDAYGDVESYSTVYYINDPDDYSTTICQEQQRECEAWMGADGSEYYFKDPGDKYCEYDSGDGQWVIAGTEEACPLANDNAAASPSQPKGPVCNGGLRSGKDCNYDSQCPAEDGDSSTYRCVADGTTYGWAGYCEPSYTGCTMYLDPQPYFQHTISGGEFETDIKTEDDITIDSGDGIPDGWLKINDGESGSGAGFGAYTEPTAFTYTDIISVTIDTEPASERIWYHDESDKGTGSSSYSYLTDIYNSGASDRDSGNPGSAQALALMMNLGSDSWDNDVTYTLTADTGSVTFTIPADVPAADEYNAFYVDTLGNVYWADEDHDGESAGYASTSTYMSSTEAMTEDHLASGTWSYTDPESVTMEVNAFYDANLSTGTIGCDTFSTSTDQVFEGTYSLNLDAGSNAHCMAAPGDIYEVDENKYYTLTANVYTEDDENQFAVGLLYFDSGYNELYAGEYPENYAIAAYEGVDRSHDIGALNEDQWMRFHAVIGPNVTNQFPDGTYYVVPFLETANMTDGTVYFDNFELYENYEYTYINNTVDGATESDENSCAGEISQKDGCVAFRDASTADLTYLSSEEKEEGVLGSSYELIPCEFDSGVEGDACRSIANTADTNSVLKVRNDRECSNWLACKTAMITTDNSGTEQATCYSVGMCEGRNEDTGVCTDWISSKDDPGYDDDQTFISSPGSTEEVFKYQDHSGFASVGGEWAGSCQIADYTCHGGLHHGESCMAAYGEADYIDCAEETVIYGQYQTDWAPEQGQGGAADTNDLVDDGDFEGVYCTGTSTGDINSVSVSSTEIETERDKTLSCTLDLHCRDANTDSAAKTYLKNIPLYWDVNDTNYQEGWCENFESDEWNSWETYGSSTAMIVDYDILPESKSFASSASGAPGDRFATSVGAWSVDLNNVLYVDPYEYTQNGIQVDIGTDIATGLDYVVTFDAAYTETPGPDTDFIQVGLTHRSYGESGTCSDVGYCQGGDQDGYSCEDDDDCAALSGAEYGTDYFEIGSKMTDIVFVVDISGSMGGYIEKVASASTALAEGLADNQIDYQLGIVTTGDSAGPHILDYDYYTTGPDAYNNGGTISRDFTSDVDEFSTVMTYFITNLGSGSEHNYEALVNLANNTFSADNNQSMNFRSGAAKFVILLTDERPDGDPYVDGTWDEDDETDLINTISSDAYVLNTIVTSGNSVAYDDISSNLGGSADYNITLESYSTILDDIVTSIDESTSAFTFTENWKSYALGPITIEEKIDAADASTLFITQAAISSGTPFIIDNVSLKPALEINKEGNSASDGSTNMIARDCRGYPEDDSQQCSYTKEGVIYTGWKGYCLEYDEYNPDSCILWWPVDVLAGEPDMISSRSTIAYTGQYPVYHCLVAKGNARLGACSSSETICIEDSDCDTGQTCIGGATDDTYNDGYNYEGDGDSSHITHTISASSYTLTHEIDNFIVDYEDTQNGEGGDSNQDYVHFEDFDVSNVEKLIHVSEIERIHFDAGDAAGASEDAPYYLGVNSLWTENVELQSELPDADPDNELIQWGSSNVDSEAGEDTGYNDTSDKLVYAYTRGVFCDGSSCDENMDADDLDEIEVIFQKMVTKYDGETSQDIANDINDGSNLFNNTHLQPDGDIWRAGDGASRGCHGRGPDEGSGLTKIDCDHDEDHEGSNDINLPSPFVGEDGDDSGYGVNVIVAKLDFDAGYPSKIYYGFFNGATNWDYSEINNIEFKYYLKEPCLLAVAGADEDANATPWMERATSGSTYIVPLNYQGSGYSNYMNTANSFFGSIGLTGSGETPADVDGLSHNFSTATADPDGGVVYDLIDIFGVAPDNLPIIGAQATIGSALPYACIGKCSEMRCQEDSYDDDGDASKEQWYDGECVSGNWIGFDGVCDYDGSPEGQEVMLCEDDADCTAYNAGSCDGEIVSGEGVGADYDTYRKQLDAAAEAAWARYRLLFADLGSTDIYYADADPSDDARNQGVFSTAELGSSEVSWLEAIVGDYNKMEECSGTRDLNDYCGIRPYLENVAIDNSYTGDHIIGHGDQVSLTFDSYADGNQEPVTNIRVVWEANDASTDDFEMSQAQFYSWEAAATLGHNMSYTYTCNPVDDSMETDPEGQLACPYHVKIQLIDNWQFCSGETRTDITRETQGTCTSYDYYDGTIWVRPSA